MAGDWFWWFSWEHLTIDRIILILIALPGGIVSLRALYKLYRYGGERIWHVIEKFFTDELGDILGKRKPVLDHIRKSPVQPRDDAAFINVHATIEEAVGLFDKGGSKDKLQAEVILGDLADRLATKANLAEKRMSLARQQAAATLLFRGSIAESRGDRGTALSCFERVLQLVPEDPDAVKFIALLRPSEAILRFDQLAVIARKRSDLGLQGEALRLKADALVEQGNDGGARDALKSAAEIEEARTDKDHSTLACTFHKYAEVTERLNGPRGVPWSAIERFEKAAEYYRLAKDEASAQKMDAEAKRLKPSGDRPTDIPRAAE